MMDSISQKAAVARICGINCGCTRDMCVYGESGCAMVQYLEEIPPVPAVPLDKLCEWLGALCDTPCMIAEGICERNCQGYKPSDAECWKTVITKWMEGLDAAD